LYGGLNNRGPVAKERRRMKCEMK